MGDDAAAPNGRLSDASEDTADTVDTATEDPDTAEVGNSGAGGEAGKPADSVAAGDGADAVADATDSGAAEPAADAADTGEAVTAADTGDAGDAGDAEDAEDAEAAAPARRRHSFPKKPRRKLTAVGWTVIGGLVLVLALGAAAGWLGYRVYQDREAQERRNLYVQVGRQGALNLTTIDHTRVDEDVKRILDSATGGFYDEFQGRAQPFSQVVRQVKSTSVGNVTEAGLESESDEGGEVLVAVTVNTTVEGQPDQPPRAWRMRILVQQTAPGEAKVANVEFVP